MKKAIFWVLLVSVPLTVVTGCARNTAKSTPQGKEVQTKQPTPAGIIPAGDQALNAHYYYLLARRHLNKGEIGQAETELTKAIEKDGTSSFLKREMIRLLLRQKKEDQALEMAEMLAAQSSENVDNLLLLAQLKKGNGDTLTDLYKKILKLAPDNKETYLRLGKIYMDTENFDQALDLFTRMADVFPDYYVAHFYLGETQLVNGLKDKAETSFLKTLELEPELVEPRFRLVNIYQDQGGKKSREKILNQYTQILKMEPGNDRATLELALFYYKTDDKKEKARELFARLGEKLKANPRLAMAAVDAFISKKRYQDAVIVFSQLKKADPDNTGLNFFLALSHEGLNNKDKAIEYYLKVPPNHPQYKKAMLSIAFLYRGTDRNDESISFLEKHHSQQPEDIDIISYLASFYDEDNRYNEAMTLLEKGLTLSPDNTALMFKLGAIQDKAGLRQDCINTMKALLREDPDHSGALNYLGYTYAEMGINLDEALDLVKRALKFKPGDGYITDSLGWVYFKKKEYDTAVLHLEKAAELSDYESIIADHLADAYEKTGQRTKALQMYKKAIENAKKEQKDLIKKIKTKIKLLEKAGSD